MDPECSMHQALTNAVTNIEIQYVDIKKDLADIKTSMTEIKTKLAIIDSHDIINKVDKMGATVTALSNAPQATQYLPYIYKIIMALIIIVGAVVGIKVTF